MEHSRLTVTGAWTKAGIASCVHVQGATKNDDFLFDCGYMDSTTTNAKVVLISHGHIDHVGSCIAHARARTLMGPPASYYVPIGIVDHLKEAKAAFEKLDNACIPMKIIGIQPGDIFHAGSCYKIKVFETIHRVPSQGYAIYSIQKGELLPEMRGLTTAELKELKQLGQAIVGPEREVLEMVYTGDTTMAGLTHSPAHSYIFQAHTLITELTYLDGDRNKAARYGHIHLDDIIENAHLFKHVQTLIFVHLSQKYSLSRAIQILRDCLPSALRGKTFVSLTSFGAAQALTAVGDAQWELAQRSTAGWGWSNHYTHSSRPQTQQLQRQTQVHSTTTSGAGTSSSKSSGYRNSSTGSMTETASRTHPVGLKTLGRGRSWSTGRAQAYIHTTTAGSSSTSAGMYHKRQRRHIGQHSEQRTHPRSHSAERANLKNTTTNSTITNNNSTSKEHLKLSD